MVCLEFFSPPLEFFTSPPPHNDLSFSEFYQILGGTAPLILPPWERPCYQYNHTELIMQIHGTYVDNKKSNTSKRYMYDSCIRGIERERFLDDSEKGQCIFCGIAIIRA